MVNSHWLMSHLQSGKVGTLPSSWLMWGRCPLAVSASLLLDLLHADWPSAHPGGAGESGAADEPGVAMADTSFSLFLCLGTCLGYERTELLGWGTLESETLELCKESLAMGARALLGIVTLEFTLESLRGTGSVDSKWRDEGGAGSWIQFRRLSWEGAVTSRNKNDSPKLQKSMLTTILHDSIPPYLLTPH